MPKPQLYYTSLTHYGLEAVQKASFMSQPLNITHLAVGDSLGSYYEPSGDMSALKGEKYRGEINRIYQDDKNPSLMIFEAIIPHTSGGYTIREAGLFDEDGNLFAIAKLAETVKPKSNEGEAKELYIRLIIEISNAANITFNMNSSAVFATHEWSHEHFAPISHISDFDNPHKVTTEQIGAATIEQLNNHIAHKDNPHKVTADQVGAAVISHYFNDGNPIYVINEDGTKEHFPYELTYKSKFPDKKTMIVISWCSHIVHKNKQSEDPSSPVSQGSHFTLEVSSPGGVSHYNIIHQRIRTDTVVHEYKFSIAENQRHIKQAGVSDIDLKLKLNHSGYKGQQLMIDNISITYAEQVIE